jgi:alkylation response protein AidB-like acyl-CoA dehydrogenase
MDWSEHDAIAETRFDMISFRPTDKDRLILDEARRQAALAARYARDFENDEDKLLPAQYPEASGLPDTRAMLEALASETRGRKIINALVYLEDWYGGVPLREARYSLGNTVLEIAGSVEQFTRWRDKTIAIGLTEPVGGSDPASTRTAARYDAATGEWVIDGEKIFITYAQSCDAVLVLARMIHPDRPQRLSTFIVEKGTPGFAVGKQIREMGIRWEDTAALSFSNCRIPAFNHIDGDLKKTLQSFSESRPVVAAYALGVSRRARFHLGTVARNRRRAGLQHSTGTPICRGGKNAAARGRVGGDLAFRSQGQMGRTTGRSGKDRFLRRQSDGRPTGAKGDADMRVRPLERIPRGKMVSRRTHLRHLRGNWRNPAIDHRTGSAQLLAQELN